jgi:hypothetical protein
MSENGLGLYIPAYQRANSWDRGKVEKLLDDTLHGIEMLLLNDENYTFLGSIITIHDTEYVTVQPKVREDVPAKVLTIIDGQQRLCTLLLFAVCLHNQIRLRHYKLLGPNPAPSDPALTWIHGQALTILSGLVGTLFEKQAYSESPIYPRMIRAFTDQWSKKTIDARYDSPIAHLLYSYAALSDQQPPTEFSPGPRSGAPEGEADLLKRFNEIRSAVKDLARGASNENLSDLPSTALMAGKKAFQQALLNHEFPSSVAAAATKQPSDDFTDLLRLVVLGAYVLNRLTLTVVRGKDEDYAFTIFESLNTTGEPLTAFETFKPRVVHAEGLGNYEQSESRRYVDAVSDYLTGYKAGDQQQAATKDLLVWFALAENGEKLSRRLADQRVYLRAQFDLYEQDKIARGEFVRHLRNTSYFAESTWLVREPIGKGTPHLYSLPIDASTDMCRLCSAFLRSLNHTVVIAPLVRLYSLAMSANDADRQARTVEFDQAIRAMTAFSVLWRASRRTTGNIDQEYRQIMAGGSNLTGLGRLARASSGSAIDVAALKQELIARLAQHGAISDQTQWVTLASGIPLYDVNQPLTRFLLLAAYHDTVEDPNSPGLVVPGKEASSPCLTFDGWRDDIHLSLEHVAPRTPNFDWQTDLYTNREVIHHIGNLVLVPRDANSSLSDRPWPQKRVLYAALGAQSKEDAKEILDNAAQQGITFADSTEALIDLSKYMPHLAALGSKTDDWDVDFIQARSVRLLELAWARLRPWLD